jgi:hypothetical protein
VNRVATLVVSVVLFSLGVFVTRRVMLNSAEAAESAALHQCEDSANRCDKVLLTCLSVQVRFIREIEELQKVCKPR